MSGGATGPAWALRLVALLAVPALLAGCGAAKETKSGQAGGGRRAIRLFVPPGGRPGIDGDFIPIFHGRRPFESGDSFIVWDNFPRAGFESIYCVIARQHPHRTFWCARTYVLAGGQIVAAGDYDDSANGDDGTLPVVGGSGAYQGARGTVTTTVGRRGGSSTIRLR